MDLGSPEEEESPPLMKWRETRAEEAWTWLGLHGGEDREESFLAATLNIFFELRLASSTKPVPTAFAKFWEFRKRERERERTFFLERQSKRKWRLWSFWFPQVVSVCLWFWHVISLINKAQTQTNPTCRLFRHTKSKSILKKGV